MDAEPVDTELGVLVATDFGDDWPLTVPSVLVTSRRVAVAGRTLTVMTFTTPDGTRYALNGTAKAHTDFKPIESTDPVWADAPGAAGLKRDIAPLIEACQQLVA